MTYQPIIGVEVHIELATNSKMFCGCPADYFGKEPNTNTCPVCLGLPGALPVPNKKAVEWTILLGLALNCQINKDSKFDRKNYFYPDLPKGYQISQYDQPLCYEGRVMVGDKEIRITRVHLEEDTGKLQHTEIGGEKVSLVDFNRSGVPLVEVVTEPDFRTIEEVDLFLKKLQRIVRYLGISSADMEKGSMRLEPSISITNQLTTDYRLQPLPKYRVELKNINSFRFARKALEYETKRQTELLEKGETPTQQTRGWSEDKSATVPQREKEEANDYRYFAEPDIPPMSFTDDQISQIRSHLPELPEAKSLRLQAEYNLTPNNADILNEDRLTADYFEEAVRVSRQIPEVENPDLVKEIANWIINKKVDIQNTVPGELIKQLLQTKSTSQVNRSELEEIIDKVLRENPQAVADYKNGRKAAIGLLIGAVLKIIKANPQTITEIIQSKLEVQ